MSDVQVRNLCFKTFDEWGCVLFLAHPGPCRNSEGSAIGPMVPLTVAEWRECELQQEIVRLRSAASFALRFVRATFVDSEDDTYEGARRVKGEWIEDLIAQLEAVTAE